MMNRERSEVHYLWPEGHPVEEVLYEQLSGPAETVAPDGDRTGDVRDRLVVDENTQSQDDFEPRTKRAVAEAMDVSLLSKGGCYEVQSASDNSYEVDVIGESCTCPDWQRRSPAAGVSTCVASTTKSSAAESLDLMADSRLWSKLPTQPSMFYSG